MKLGIVVAVFPIIFIGELPDKTMFAALLLSTRGKPTAIWLGAAVAFVIHVVIAVTAGVALFHILPHRAVEAVVAALFLGGAVLALREGLHERQHEEREQELVRKEEARAPSRGTVATALIVIFLAEWGDLTQVLTANLAAHFRSPLSVGVGSLLALWVVAAIAVAGGQGLLRFVNIATVRFVTAVMLTGLAIYAAAIAI